MAISVSFLVGISLATAVFQAFSLGFVMVFASLSHPWILIVDGKSLYFACPLIPLPWALTLRVNDNVLGSSKSVL